MALPLVSDIIEPLERIRLIKLTESKEKNDQVIAFTDYFIRNSSDDSYLTSNIKIIIDSVEIQSHLYLHMKYFLGAKDVTDQKYIGTIRMLSNLIDWNKLKLGHLKNLFKILQLTDDNSKTICSMLLTNIAFINYYAYILNNGSVVFENDKIKTTNLENMFYIISSDFPADIIKYTDNTYNVMECLGYNPDDGLAIMLTEDEEKEINDANLPLDRFLFEVIDTFERIGEPDLKLSKYFRTFVTLLNIGSPLCNLLKIFLKAQEMNDVQFYAVVSSVLIKNKISYQNLCELLKEAQVILERDNGLALQITKKDDIATALIIHDLKCEIINVPAIEMSRDHITLKLLDHKDLLTI